jgi:hypothetical protein
MNTWRVLGFNSKNSTYNITLLIDFSHDIFKEKNNYLFGINI